MKKGICIYLNEKEMELLKQKAQENQTKKSKYIREILLNLPYLENKKDFTELLIVNKELLKYLNNIGNNINQIAFVLNSKKYQDSETILKEIQSLKEILKEYLQFLRTEINPNLFKNKRFLKKQGINNDNQQ